MIKSTNSFNIDFILTQNLPDLFAEKGTTEPTIKLVLEGRELKILSAEAIESAKNQGLSVVEALDDIIELVNSINVSSFDLKEGRTLILLKNYQWINAQAGKHNKKITQQFCQKVMQDRSVGEKAALFQQLSNEDQQWLFDHLSAEEQFAILSELPEPLKVKCLGIVDNSVLLQYFDQLSFFERFQLNNLSMEDVKSQITPDHAKVLARLLQLNHNPTTKEELSAPLLRYIVIAELKMHFEANDVEAEKAERALMNLLQSFEIFLKFISEAELLSTLIFVRENRHLIASNSFGTKARSRDWIRKFQAMKHRIPKNLEYDLSTNEWFMLSGGLGKGQYKVAKKQLCLSPSGLHLEANCKQEVKKDKNSTNKSVAEQELSMLKRAKRLPNVISLRGHRHYVSQKKGKLILATRHPLYTLGSLHNHVQKGSGLKVNYKEKLQITVDIIKGMEGLQSKKIIHRDIKTDNIFLHQRIRQGKIVKRAIVGDLGLAYLETEKRTGLGGTPLYFAPEVFASSSSDFRSDAWALGITLAELFRGINPIDDPILANSYSDVMRHGQAFQNNPQPKDVHSIEFIIWKLLRPNLDERMTIPEALTIAKNLLAAEQKREALFGDLMHRSEPGINGATSIDNNDDNDY